MRYVCTVCGYVYDEADNTPFADLPEDWKCPLCGASKGEFVPEGTASAAAEPEPSSPAETEIRLLTAAETSALCSNLAKGCEKQVKLSRIRLSDSCWRRSMPTWMKAILRPDGCHGRRATAGHSGAWSGAKR